MDQNKESSVLPGTLSTWLDAFCQAHLIPPDQAFAQAVRDYLELHAAHLKPKRYQPPPNSST